MNALKKKRVATVMKYTWPFYIVVALVIGLLMHFVFRITHRTPTYKTLTLFVSGEVTNLDKLESDMMNKFKDKDLKSFSCISSRPDESGYNTKLTVAGYNSADVLIIPISKLDNLVVSAFALDMSDEMINSYYQGYTLYQQDNINYGVKIDKTKVSSYMTLPNEDCYMVFNGKSVNTGEYSASQIKEHDNALVVVKNWGM